MAGVDLKKFTKVPKLKVKTLGFFFGRQKDSWVFKKLNSITHLETDEEWP